MSFTCPLDLHSNFNRYTSHIPSRPLGQSLQSSQVAVEDVRVATVSIRVRVLPDGLIWPATGDGARSASIASQDKWVRVDKGVRVARASCPPRGVGVQQGVSARLGSVPVAKGLDPGDHSALREAPATGISACILKVKHARQCDAIAGPPTAMGNEIIGLDCTRSLPGVCKVVATADQTSIGGVGVIDVELGIDVVVALGRLHLFVSPCFPIGVSHRLALMMTKRAPELYAAAKLTLDCQWETSNPWTAACAAPKRDNAVAIVDFMLPGE